MRGLLALFLKESATVAPHWLAILTLVGMSAAAQLLGTDVTLDGLSTRVEGGEFANFLVWLMSFSIGLCLVAPEFGEGQIEFLDSLPTSRTRLFLCKLVAGGLPCLAMVLSSLLVDLCIAVVARSQDIREIGIDVEEYTPLEQNLWAEICIEEEIAWLNTQPHELRGYLAKRIFSAKEAVYKAVFPRIRQVLEFDAITVDFEQSLASCFLSHKRIVSLWADRGQSPWFSVDLPQQKQPVSESSKGLFAC